METREPAGTVALVTGAAGGIGHEIVRHLAAGGASVAAVDNDERRLKEISVQLVGEGLPVAAYPLDVTTSAAVDDGVARIEAELGPIDVLVNAAGVLRHGSATELSDADWANTFAVNTTGVFFVSRAVGARMIPRRRGVVVTITSNAATVPRTGMAAYSASKAAATMLSRCLGLELARYGIRCNSVGPGSTDTAMLRGLWNDGGAERISIDGKPEEFRLGIPLGRIAQPADIANAVGFLVSAAGKHITMQHLTVDGGAGLGA
ncbi:2,3-dihydro-2,3-dihydroxybenzoate dehydrogenase [Nocardia sp. BMG51109]|uniref:2,3-dihydro-2,3-dihydroxybenzoate dehydrogenase n=1 Tax=Nocardia sp. BMG51109 TaxID=1056816 RepID=UPI000464A6B5|nr:2,3-dihydro-2,3-dihydroxybenzoate dehydrogenase [Nocardia sp. BMG51109]